MSRTARELSLRPVHPRRASAGARAGRRAAPWVARYLSSVRSAASSFPWPAGQRLVYWVPLAWWAADKTTLQFAVIPPDLHRVLGWSALGGTAALILAIEIRLSVQRRHQRSGRHLALAGTIMPSPADAEMAEMSDRLEAQDQRIAQLVATMERMCEAAGMRCAVREPLRLVGKEDSGAA